MNRLHDTEHSGIEMLPKGWEIKKLGELFDFSGGMPFSRSALSEEGFLYLHYGDIHKKNQAVFDTKNDFNWLPKIKIDINKVKDYALLNTGDIVFADASEDYEGVGKSVVIINKENKTFISGLHTIVAKDKTGLLDIGYKKYFLSSAFTRNQFTKIATGATVFGISKSNIKQIKVLVPSFVEQQKIASILSSVDEAIEKTEVIIEQTEKVKKGLMQQLLTKGIGHTKFKKTEIGEIPNDWDILSFNDVLSFVGSGVTPKGGSSVYQLEGIPFIRSQNVYPDGLRLNDIAFVSHKIHEKMSRSKVQEHDVLLNITGASIGRCTHVPTGFGEANVNQHVCILRTNGKVYYKYLSYFMNSVLGQNQVFSEQAGQTREGLNYQQIRAFNIPVPLMNEQEKIADIIESFNNKVNNEKNKLGRLQNLKQGLMQSFLTGKVRVKVGETEVTQV